MEATWFQYVCLIVFMVLMIAPGLYGLHLYALLFLAARRRGSVRRTQQELVERFSASARDEDWPIVTTQIPIYNELTVAARVIEAVARLDYPRGRHEVQVLDDSTDTTREIVDRVVQRLRAEGHEVNVLRRRKRTHYKAGALAAGLQQARGEYVAVFDADFVPPTDFLRRLIPLIVETPQAGCVQARWGHLNANENWLTQGLSLGIDGHFGVEQGARAWNGYLLNFNGTGGIWRRVAIDDPAVGGWSGDTITEDLDLSYRAQLAGWKIIYTADDVAPAEIPAEVNALKAQQRRWATGSIQTACKMLPKVWASPRLSLLQKSEASVHLTQYAVNVFMVLMAAFGRPLLWLIPEPVYRPWLASSSLIVLIAMAAPSITYIYARFSLCREFPSLLKILKLIVLGLGLSLNNCVAVLVGFVQRGGEFVRTPKSGSRSDEGVTPVTTARTAYAAIRSQLWIGEIVLGTLCFFQWVFFLRADSYVGGTFLLLYAIGLTALGWGSRPSTMRPSAAPAVKATVRTSEAYRQPAAEVVAPSDAAA